MDHGVQPTSERELALKGAAADLADRLEKLAAAVSATVTPERCPYGDSRLPTAFRRRSPAGFNTGARSLQLLLPDGRLWWYSRSDARRFPQGRFYDARSDYVDYSAGRTSPSGTSFTFLGAAVGKYTFGLVEPDDPLAASGLGCMITDEGPVHFVDPDEAFADLAAMMVSRLGNEQI